MAQAAAQEKDLQRGGVCAGAAPNAALKALFRVRRRGKAVIEADIPRTAAEEAVSEGRGAVACLNAQGAVCRQIEMGAGDHAGGGLHRFGIVIMGRGVYDRRELGGIVADIVDAAGVKEENVFLIDAIHTEGDLRPERHMLLFA